MKIERWQAEAPKFPWESVKSAGKLFLPIGQVKTVAG